MVTAEKLERAGAIITKGLTVREAAMRLNTLKNCRLVLQAVNFALNVWGDEIFLEIAAAATRHKAGELRREEAAKLRAQATATTP